MAINVSVQYNGGFLPDVMPLTLSVPSPSETWFRVLVWEGLSGGCRAGLTLERCSQLAAFAIRPVG